MRDQGKGCAIAPGQGKGLPPGTHEEVGLVVALREEAVQRLGGGEVTVAKAHLARHGRAAQQGSRPILVGQFQIEEAATAKIITTMDPPVAALAAGLADRRAVHHPQAAPGPTEGGPPARSASCCSSNALRNGTAWSSRDLTAGSLSCARPCIAAQAAVWFSDSPPGPRAMARRSSVVPSPTSRRRFSAPLENASASRSRSGGTRSSTSCHG